MVLWTVVSRGGLLAKCPGTSVAVGKDTGESKEFASSEDGAGAGTGNMSSGGTVLPSGVRMAILDGSLTGCSPVG